jgi:hypothetical protein
MSDWQTRLDEWERRLAAWNAVHEREYRQALGRRRRFLRRPSREAIEAAEAEALRAAGADTPVELFALLDALAADYLAAELPQDQAKLRAWIGARPALFRALWSYAEQAPGLIRSAADARRLELALAAVSLDDGRIGSDRRDAALGALYLAARRAGIDPAPALRSVAARSNPGTGGGGAHTRQVLAGFERSFYFEREVRPKLLAS